MYVQLMVSMAFLSVCMYFRVEQMRRNVIDIDAEKEKCKVAVKDAQKERVKAIDALTHLLCVSCQVNVL